MEEKPWFIYNCLLTTEEEDNLIKEYHRYAHQNNYGGKQNFDLDKIKENEYVIGSVRICLSTLYALCQCSYEAQMIYITFLHKVYINHNVVNLTLKQIKNFSQLSYVSINKGIYELEEAGLIEILEKDFYKLPIRDIYKGNSWPIIEQMQINYFRKKDEIKYEEQLEIKRNSDYLKDKLKLKSKNNE